MNIPTYRSRPLMMQGIILGFLMIATLVGCGGNSSSSRPAPVTPEGITAVIATTSPDYASGEVELIDLDTDQMTASGGYHSTVSDIAVTSYGTHYYLIERFSTDRISKVDIANPAIFQWRYSAVSSDDTDSTNPYDLIFVNEEKAYLIRYDASTAWIVNPTASNESDFFLGELDLSAYAIGSAAAPHMSAGVIIGDRLFISMQRLDASWEPSHTAYVAVFDINTDEEIDTGMGEGSLKGIPLVSRNPLSMQYHPDLGLLVQGVGSYLGWTHLGGIDRIDPATFGVTQILTGDEDLGRIGQFALVDGTTAYISANKTYGYDNARVFRIDPRTGEVRSEIESVAGRDLRALAVDPLGRLWIGDATTSRPGLRVMDPANDSEVAFIPTSMLPIDIAFTAED